MSGRVYAPGRKVESTVWNYFTIDYVKNECVCKSCNRKITGRNSTNAKNHLKSFHRSLYECTQLDDENLKLKKTKIQQVRKSPCASGSAVVGGIASLLKVKPLSKWGPDSSQKKSKDDALIKMFVECGVPFNVIRKEAFRHFCTTLDAKYSVPSNKKLVQLAIAKYQQSVLQLKEAIKHARRFHLGMDIWTKKGYTSSYLAITVCFFNPKTHVAVHAMLNLFSIAHPHTGDMISDKIAECLQQWNISREKVCLIITDNGSNMVRALKCLNERLEEEEDEDMQQVEQCEVEEAQPVNEHIEAEEHQDQDLHEESYAVGSQESEETGQLEMTVTSEDFEDYILQESDEEQETNEGCREHDINDTDADVTIEFEPAFRYKRLPCVVHTLQLTVKSLDKCDSFVAATTKARSVVRAIRASSVATQLLTQKCGKTVIADCPTRWSSCYMMLSRLIELRDPVRQVCEEMGFDCLLKSEWTKVENIVKVLQPFAEHTNTLQTNSCSLGSVIPVVLDLIVYLKAMPTDAVAQVLLKSVHSRFDMYISPNCLLFDPLPVAVCLLSPDVATILLTAERKSLLESAKNHVLQLLQQSTLSHNNAQVRIHSAF